MTDTNIKAKPIFSIIFKDGTTFTGGTSYFETKWTSVPLKEVKRLFYLLPDGNYLCLGEYDQFFHMVEAVQDWMRVSKGNVKNLKNTKPRIEYAYVMGKKNGIVDSYRITLFESKDSRYKIGDIIKRQFSINDKFIRKLNPDNWIGNVIKRENK